MNKKAVVFSDLHLHNYTQFSGVDEKWGVNARMLVGIDILQQIHLYCVNNNINVCIFGGDLFHRGDSLSPDMIYFLADILNNLFKEDGIEIIAIPGQHDYMFKDGRFNAVLAFCHLIRPLDHMPAEIFGDVRIIPVLNKSSIEDQRITINYAKSLIDKVNKDVTNVLLGHFLVKEIVEKGNLNIPTEGLISAKELNGFDLCLLGDYHDYVFLAPENIISIGATHQHQFAPYPQNRQYGSFIVYDFVDHSFERVPIDAPLFINVDNRVIEKGELLTKNYYRIKCKDEKEAAKIKKDNPGAHVTFVIDDEDNNQASEVRLDVKVSLEPEEIIDRYVDYMGASKETANNGKEYYKITSARGDTV